MAKDDFEKIFIDDLNTQYDAEIQLLEVFPRLITATFTPNLKSAFEKLSTETKKHIERLENIFSLLHIQVKKTDCDAMMGLIKATNKVLQTPPSAVEDAHIIGSIQRIAHYKIACYGIAKTFAEHLDHVDMANILKDCLDDSTRMDKTLTALAEGGLFALGINEQAKAE